MKGPLNAVREQCIFDAFNKVANGSQSVAIGQMAEAMCCSEEERDRRMNAMDLNADKMISFKEFKEFHWCLSANFKSDDEFITEMK